jgi:hypothetical protein
MAKKGNLFMKSEDNTAKPTVEANVKSKDGCSHKEPTGFEIIQVAAQLAIAERNQEKTPLELVQEASVFWDALAKMRHIQNEKRILLATVGKMRDDEYLFEESRQMDERRKGPPPITDAMWWRRFMEYKGDKHDLFLDLLRTEIPMAEFVSQLFSSSGDALKPMMDELLRYGGNNWTQAGDAGVLAALALPENEMKSLTKALHTGDIRYAELWLDKYDLDGTCRWALNEFFWTAKRFNTGSWSPRQEFIPALMCRDLIRLRRMQLSGIRSEVAKKRVAKLKLKMKKSGSKSVSKC